MTDHESDPGAEIGTDPGTDPSRVEAVEAGLAHEAAETDWGVPPRSHVAGATGTAAESPSPDAPAQEANDDVEVAEPPGPLGWVLVATVAVAVVLAVVAIAMASAGP